MTLFYLRSGRDPMPCEHNYSDWPKALTDLARRHIISSWRSLSIRYFRLVRNMTADQQSQRPSITESENELIRLRSALIDERNVCSASILAEELSARVFGFEYDWDAESTLAVHRIGRCCEVKISGNETSHSIGFIINWINDETAHFRTVKKYVPSVIADVQAVIKRSLWACSTYDQSKGGIRISSEADLYLVRQDIANATEAIESCIACFRRLTA
jgi:hypothetical protein